jgi:hypothetical protein
MLQFLPQPIMPQRRNIVCSQTSKQAVYQPILACYCYVHAQLRAQQIWGLIAPTFRPQTPGAPSPSRRHVCVCQPPQQGACRLPCCQRCCEAVYALIMHLCWTSSCHQCGTQAARRPAARCWCHLLPRWLAGQWVLLAGTHLMLGTSTPTGAVPVQRSACPPRLTSRWLPVAWRPGDFALCAVWSTVSVCVCACICVHPAQPCPHPMSTACWW